MQLCYIATHMSDKVGVRELRQNLSKYLDRVKAGDDLVVTERGRVVARLVPAGASADAYADLASRLGSTVPIEPIEKIAAHLSPRSAPAGTTDAYLAEGRAERIG
jgi:prevent-host-death family protein